METLVGRHFDIEEEKLRTKCQSSENTNHPIILRETDWILISY